MQSWFGTKWHVRRLDATPPEPKLFKTRQLPAASSTHVRDPRGIVDSPDSLLHPEVDPTSTGVGTRLTQANRGVGQRATSMRLEDRETSTRGFPGSDSGKPPFTIPEEEEEEEDDEEGEERRLVVKLSEGGHRERLQRGRLVQKATDRHLVRKFPPLRIRRQGLNWLLHPWKNTNHVSSPPPSLSVPPSLAAVLGSGGGIAGGSKLRALRALPASSVYALLRRSHLAGSESKASDSLPSGSGGVVWFHLLRKAMASEASKPRFVKCPKCLRLLMEIAGVPVYKCGACGTILQAKARHVDLQQNPPCSTSENSSRGDESNDLSEEDPPSRRENADVEAGSAPKFSYPAGQSAAMAVDIISMLSAPQPQLGGSGTHSKHGSVNSVEMTESVISEEEVLDGIPGSSLIRNPVTSIASSSHSYELGVSSGDDISGKHERYRRLSRRTFRYRNSSESSSGEARDRKEGDLAGKNQPAPLNEMCDASDVGISSLKQRSSSRNSDHTSDPDDRSGSEGFFPLQIEIESDQLSSASRSPSRDSTSAEDFPCDILGDISSSRLGNLQRDRAMEPPGRVDLLRDQPSKPYAGGRRGDQRVPVGGRRHDGLRPPVFSNPISEQVLTSLYNGDMPQWQSAASRRKPIAQRYMSPGVPLPAEGNGSRLHHHPEGWSVPAHCGPCSLQSYSHPSTASSSGFSDLDRDHHRGKLPGKEKRQHRKRRQCRPVSGGAPFVVCDKCLELLQLPVDFLICRGRLHKLRCGACSEVLTFLYQGGHIAPHHASIHELSAHPSQDTLHEDPVSYSEENGPPPSQTYSTDGEPCTLRSSPEEEGKKRYKQLMGDPPLHHLLGYASARDLIFVPGDEDDIYQGIDMSRFRSVPGDVHDQGCGGTGRSPPKVGHSPNHSEIEEERPALRLPGSRRRPPVHGFVRGDVEELSRGLENMKLRSNRNGRPW
ncbi:hypothetical protein Taro_053766 [Colocasia esculenta]|uniref:Zinc-ribbon domain-containing protein n=1 Tax=Colocasia esculenta TaxID=4460 RepID=A0A843XN38_COLES|nr:hypothetical protein [Colocasia esculenta]